MRKLLVLAALAASIAVEQAALAEEVSNPAFLGVGMQDVVQATKTSPAGPCRIDTVTRDSGAAAAGVRSGDIVVSLDGAPIQNCDGLVTAIQNKVPGQTVNITVQRAGADLTLSATLPSRGDVLRKRFVGKPLPTSPDKSPLTLVRVDDDKVADLSPRGKATMIGWFDQRGCTNCAQAFSAVQAWARGKSSVNVFAATASLHDMKSVSEMVASLKVEQRKFDVPLVVADAATYNDLSITDIKRIHFMVVDCRGLVSYVTPLNPDADDKGAVLEELFAAAEQATKRPK